MTREEQIAQNIGDWRRRLGDVTLCAVTKTMPVEDINCAIRAGITDIGENRVQELTEKLDSIDPGARVHLIGRLQTNKVKYIIGRISLLQSLDRDELAIEVSRRSDQKGVLTRALVEVNIAREPQKGGVDPDALFPALERWARLPGLGIEGLMAVMPAAEDPEMVRPYMRRMRALFDEVAHARIPGVSCSVLSMGMSGDCLVAAEEGSTMVRIGRGIFGARG